MFDVENDFETIRIEWAEILKTIFELCKINFENLKL